MSVTAPELTYFCELEPQPLKELFTNPEVIEFLRDSHAAVSLGILDLSEERADIVCQLNNAGVPVIAWLLLPKDQGYWFNLDNYPQALARYRQFKDWSQARGLSWARIGLDIEPDISSVQSLSAWRALTGAVNPARLRNGSRAYHTLIEQIHADGYPVETYQFPFIVDERMTRSSLLQRLTGLVDLPEADREVLMLYSSFMRPWGQGILWSYGPQAQGIGIGSTGGGVDLPKGLTTPPLNWSELEMDLLLGRQHSNHMFVFSLEGCVRQNFLPQLRTIDWEKRVELPYSAALRAENLRKMFRRALWLSTRPALLLFGLAMLVSAIALVSRMQDKQD